MPKESRSSRIDWVALLLGFIERMIAVGMLAS